MLNPLGDSDDPNPRREFPDGPWINRGFHAQGNVHVFGCTSQNRWKSYKLSMRVKTQQDVEFPVYGDEGASSHDLFILDATVNTITGTSSSDTIRGALGALLEWLLFTHLYKRDHLEQVLLTYGLILIFEEVRSLIFGDDVHGVDVPALFAATRSIRNRLQI